MLPREDEDAARVVEAGLKSAGVRIVPGRAESASREGNTTTLALSDGSTVSAEAVLVAVGRVPNTDGIGLDEAGVELTDRGFVAVDEHLRTTAQGVWGELRQAIVEERSLPERTFLDAAGAFTTDPQRVQGVLPFGGARGAALCMALEILTGAFVGAKMGGEIRDEYDLGYLFCALSPEMFSSADDFIAQTSALAEAVRTSAPAAGNAQVFVPGERSAQRRSEQLARGTVELEADVYDRIRAMSLSREGGYENSRSMN